MLVGDVGAQVHDQTHHTAGHGARAITGDGDEIHMMRHGHAPCEVCQEDEAAAEHAHQDDVFVMGIVGVDLPRQLQDARLDVGLRDVGGERGCAVGLGHGG